MKQKYKFGDRVRFADNPEQIGIVFEVTEKKVQVGWNDGYTSFQNHDDNMEIIPNPDTVILDWIEQAFGDNEACYIKKGSRTYRETLTRAMEQWEKNNKK